MLKYSFSCNGSGQLMLLVPELLNLLQQMSASCCYCMHACKKRAPLPPANPCMFNMRQIIWKLYANIYLFWWLRVRTARVGVFKCGERKKKLHFKKFNHLPWGWCLNKTHSERWLQRVHSCSINIVETIMHLLYIKKKKIVKTKHWQRPWCQRNYSGEIEGVVIRVNHYKFQHFSSSFPLQCGLEDSYTTQHCLPK